MSEGEVFDPIRIYARLMKYYGLSDMRLDQMDYRRFFGLLREMQVMNDEEREQQQRDQDRQQGTEIDPTAWESLS